MSLNWTYDEFAQMTESIFPHRMMVSINTQNRKLDSELKFTGIEINEPFSISISIPNGYRKVAIADILKLLRSMKILVLISVFLFSVTLLFSQTEQQRTCKDRGKQFRR